MKLELDKGWYEKRIAQEGDLEVTAGAPLEEQDAQERPARSLRPSEDVFPGLDAFGSLVQMLRRDRYLSVEQLASSARVDVREIVFIERDPRYVPKPRTVHQLAVYFGLPDRALIKLSNLTTVHSPRLTDAAVRFAAHSQRVRELDREEREALAEFVKVLSSEQSD